MKMLISMIDANMEPRWQLKKRGHRKRTHYEPF